MPRTKLQDIAYMIATWGPIGALPAARVWASLIGVVYIYLGRTLFMLSSAVGWALSGVLLLAAIGISIYVRSWTDDSQEEHIILDRAAGVVIALALLPGATLKYTLFGFGAFHLWMFVSMLAQRVYGYNHKLLPSNLSLSTGEILLIAVLTNTALRFLLWVTH